MSPREAAGEIWRSALAAGDPGPLLRQAMVIEGACLRAGGLALDLDRVRRVIVLGCGKAGAGMAEAVEAILGDRIADGFVVVKEGHGRPLGKVRIAEAGHPIPDRRGQAAASTLLDMARSASAADLVVFLVSGGGSALTPAPAPPVTLEEKRAVTRSLLAAGATIGELNAVRKHLSLLKGGQLARAVAPATVLTLILSDVIGDPLDVIASGPTAPDPTTFADALEVLRRKELLDAAPASIRERLLAGARGEIEETPKPGDPLFARVTTVVLGNNGLITGAAASASVRLGYRTELLTRPLEGEARDVARALVERARGLEPPACLIAGGETTVTVRGQGKGGRCQELALAASVAIEGTRDLVVLAAGTDGTDGPTDAAGAIVDGGTVARGLRGKLDARAALDDNDSYRFLEASGDLIVSGPTGTNLLDLYVVIHE